MLIRRMTGMLLAIMIAAIPVAASAQEAPVKKDAPPGVIELRQEASRAYHEKDYPAFRNAMIGLNGLRPNNSEYMYQLVLAHALLNERTSAFNVMLKMQRQGLAYDFDQTPDSTSLRGTQLYTYLNDLMKRAGESYGEVIEVATLAKDVELPEAIDWDPGRNAFIVGTVAEGMILAVGRDGAATELLRADNENGMWGVYDVMVDTARDRLWVSSAATPQFSGFSPVDKGRSVVIEFELESLELVKHYPVPVDGRPHSLGNMAMAANGDLFVADGRLPVIYVKRAGEERLKPFFGSRFLVSLRGMAASDDGRNMYVADYEMGITRIELETGQVSLLPLPETLNPGGIDGLDYWNGNLVIVQNGISPQRVMLLQLDDTGTAVANVAPLAVAHDLFDSPNYGTVLENDFFFFANSHWGSSGDDIKPVKIVRVDLDDRPTLVAPDMQKFLDKYQQSREGSGEEFDPTPGLLKKEEEKKDDS